MATFRPRVSSLTQCVDCEAIAGVGITLIGGHHDTTFGVQFQYTLLLDVSPPMDSPFAAVRLGLRVKVPANYPQDDTVVVADPVPWHPNINKADGTVSIRPVDDPAHFDTSQQSMSVLSAAYQSLLASPRLAGAINLEAASLMATDENAYLLLAAYSVGHPFPTWSPATHSFFPAAVRASICSLLLVVRGLERRASNTVAAQDEGAHWPTAQPLPDDALHRIIAMYADGELHALCRRHGLDSTS